MTSPGIRWVRRFKHFDKAFAQLKEGVELAQERTLSNTKS
jgi:hypothetical protein